MTERPELQMIRRGLPLAAAGFVVAAAVGWLVGGAGPAATAAIGVAIVFANFAAHGWSLAWASRYSIALVQGVALAGIVVRLGVIVGAMFALNTLAWFSPTAFALAVVPATVVLLAYEARLAIKGLGGTLQIPADPPAVRAGATLAAREALDAR